MPNPFADLGIEYSANVQTRNVKILLWGGTGTRKTETLLRYFPNVFIADAEGNTDQCINHPDIPPFLRIKTKDTRKVIAALDYCAGSQIKMPDGSPVRTFGVDSESVLWSVQADAASAMAEERARKRGKSVEEADTTLKDWGKAKRPLKTLHTRFANSPLHFLVIIAREKPLMEEVVGQNGFKELKQTGVIPDCIKGTEYEVNLALHLSYEDRERKKWYAEVTKVQGALATLFPMGKKITRWPTEELLGYASRLAAGGQAIEDEEELAGAIAREEVAEEEPRTKTRLVEIGREFNLSPSDVGNVLSQAGIQFDPNRWEEMVSLIKATANTNGK